MTRCGMTRCGMTRRESVRPAARVRLFGEASKTYVRRRHGTGGDPASNPWWRPSEEASGEAESQRRDTVQPDTPRAREVDVGGALREDIVLRRRRRSPQEMCNACAQGQGLQADRLKACDTDVLTSDRSPSRRGGVPREEERTRRPDAEAADRVRPRERRGAAIRFVRRAQGRMSYAR